MRALLVVLAIAGGCRTRLLDDSDAAPPLDSSSSELSSTADLSSAPDLTTTLDLASPPDLHRACGIRCAPTDWCVFIDQGDCSKWDCVPRPAGCSDPCRCLPSSFCSMYSRSGEMVSCKPPEPSVGGDLTCDDLYKCI